MISRKKPSYRSRSIKRSRRTKTAIQNLKQSLVDVVKEIQPATVRQIFYQMVSRGLIEKTEASYKNTVVRLLTDLRVEGAVMPLDTANAAPDITPSERMAFDSLSDDKPTLQQTKVNRTILTEDLANATLYEQQFYDKLPELIPGTTAIGTSCSSASKRTMPAPPRACRAAATNITWTLRTRSTCRT